MQNDPQASMVKTGDGGLGVGNVRGVGEADGGDRQKSMRIDEGQFSLTPIRRNSEDMINDMGGFVPSPQELYQRLNSNKELSNPSNVSESDILVSAHVSQPAYSLKEKAD